METKFLSLYMCLIDNHDIFKKFTTMESIIMPSEVDFYVDTMRPFRIQDLGTNNWLDWHERLQKLNQEAIINASALQEEYVKETVINLGKARILVHEAILVSVWKQKILPIMLQLDANPDNTFIAYSIMYHELVALGLLELVMFDSSGCESLGEAAADLLEYAFEGATQLLVIECKEFKVGETSRCELLRQKEDLAFNVGMKCLTIIRYLSQNLDRLPVAVATRMYSIHDVPILFVQILLERPWFKNGKNFHQGRWVEGGDSEVLNKSEAQIWLTLHHLLLNKASLTYYTITSGRKLQLLKLLPLLTPVLLDQLALLIELNHWLCQLSACGLQADIQKPLMIEPLLEIRNDIMNDAQKNWKKIAREQVAVVFCSDKKQLMEVAQKLSAAYNMDLLEKFESKPKETCSVCGNAAMQRCSKCKRAWYCSRSCQVRDWEIHKTKCES